MRPTWWPGWLRRRFPGRWTQAEVDQIKREAATEAAELRLLWDDDALATTRAQPGNDTARKDEG